MKTAAIIQCHSVGWEGTTDVSLRVAPDGRRVIEEVIERAGRVDGLCAPPVIACPDVAENAIFEELAAAHGCLIYRGSVDNVLDRLVGACESVGARRMAWIQGIHYFLDVELMNRLLSWSTENGYDYARCVDGSLKQVLGQVLQVDAIERARRLISELPETRRNWFRARPFAFMRSHPDDFNIGLFEELPDYDDRQLENIRATARSIYLEGRALHTGKAMGVGDVSIGRYREILDRIEPGDKVLDIACGTGFGARLMVDHGAEVVGVDIDLGTIELARQRHGDVAEFRHGNAERIPLDDDTVDVVVSMATIEHVPDDVAFVREIQRVLRPGGRFIAYTPQNRMGEKPIWPWHEREYSLKDLHQLINTSLRLDHIEGWQNGILTPDDPRGDGSYVFAYAD